MQQRRTITSLVSILMAGHLVVTSWGPAVPSWGLFTGTRVVTPSIALALDTSQLVARLSIVLALLASSANAAPALTPPKTGEPIVDNAGLAYGAWQDSVAIDVPAAPNASQPSIAIVASNSTVDGDVGSRWALQASSAITHHSTSGGAPNFTIGGNGFPVDLYRLDGMDLVSVSSPAPTHYEPETWDGSTLTYSAATNTWTRKRSGWTWTYGTGAGTGVNATRTIVNTATITLPHPGIFTTCSSALCKTSMWHLSKVVDPFGNVTIYNYKKGTTVTGYPNHTHLLDTITYAGNTIEFGYGARKVTRFAVQAGSPTALADRLKEIKTKVGTVQFSRYVLQYEDETTDSRLGTLTDCGGAAVVVPTMVKQDLLRKIVRVGTSSATQHTLRCMRWRHEETTWQDDSAAKVLDVVDAPTSHVDLLEESVIPIATTFNDDGVTDLLVIGVRPGSARVRVYIATPKLDRVFASATTGSGKPHDDAVLWETELSADLTASLFDNRRGWAIADIDNNLTPEIFYENANGDVTMRRFNGSGFSSVVTGLDGCDLRHSSFADIDGDLRPDLVVRAHGDAHGCPEVTQTKWIRNTGTGTYFLSFVARQLKVPLEAVTKPTAWTTIMNGVCSAAGTLRTGPYDLNPSWEFSEEAYVADHTRVTDVNDDGIADVVMSLYGCWTTTGDVPAGGDNDADWEPVDGSLYSEIWLGDGNGNFIATGRSAGLPLTFDLEDAGSSAIVTNRLVSGQFSPVDIDRNGISELFTSRPTSEGAQGRLSTYANLTLGWNLASDVGATNGVTTPALYYLSPACNCYLRIGAQAMGDFDGDGMLDIVRIATDDFTVAPSSTPCTANTWCATLHRNLRTGSEGQLLSVDGPWGGRTQLTWGFSAHEPHDNPRLRSNLEVIEEVDGADGGVGLTYSGAFTYGTRPTPFAQVERQNARGGVDQFGYVTAPWAVGKRTHAARFRTDGTLERVEVDVHGYIWNGSYLMSHSKPYFNPRVRECVYDVGNGSIGKIQSYDVGDLIVRCYEFTGGILGPGVFENGPGMYQVSKANVPMVLGHTEGMLMESNPVVSQQAYQAAFGNASANGVLLMTGTISDIDAWDYSLEGHDLPRTSFFSFPNLPVEFVGKVPDVKATEENYVYPVDPIPTLRIPRIPATQSMGKWFWRDFGDLTL